MSDYPKRHADVEVIFLDGTIQTYRINAGATIAQYLAQQAGETGILSLLSGAKAYGVPAANIREWNITELEGDMTNE